jgi:Iron-containing alcohol dehydrogenase
MVGEPSIKDKGFPMNCCHADFALAEGSDRGFTVGMPTFTFGSGSLNEAGSQAQELGLKRVAVFTDRYIRASEPFATVMASLAAANIEAVVFDEISIEPTDASFQAAARFAREANVDGYISVGGGSVMDTCKAANLYACYPADFMTYVNAPIGAGQRVPGPVKTHIACPTTSGTGSETTGISIFNLQSKNAKTGIISRRLIPTVALIDPDVTKTLPAKMVAATGFDCMSHALEAITARGRSPRQSRDRDDENHGHAERPVGARRRGRSDRCAGERRRTAVPGDPQCARGRRARRAQNAFPLGASILVTGCDSSGATGARCTRPAGSRTAKVLPLPGSLAISSVAWCRSRTCLTMASPRPVPPVARDRLRSMR